MRIATLRRGRRESELPGVTGTARLEHTAGSLLRRLADGDHKTLAAGDIAVIDHVDLDRGSAEALVSAGVAAVVNASPSISGRYPTLGPEILVANGIPLLDTVGAQVFDELRDGAKVRLNGTTLYVGDRAVATGIRHTTDSVADAMQAARAGLTSQLESFAASTISYLKSERELLLDGSGIPKVRTDFRGEHAVVVARGYDDRADLAAIRAYIREYHPVLIGVNAGADTLLDAGLDPDVVIADLDLVSDQALCSGAEIVVHVQPGSRTPGFERLQDLDVDGVVFRSSGTAEDCALLLADSHGAALIVTVGTYATLTEFLDRGREGMASTFLTRLRVGGKLVNARAVPAMYRPRISGAGLLLLVLAAIIAAAAALTAADAGHPLADTLTDVWHRLTGWIQ
jgi:uncharacterized membrane-anchored protein